MQVEVTPSNETTIDVVVQVEESRVRKQVAARLKELSRTAKVDGFRVGKVPTDVIRKRYGRSARLDAVENVVQSAVVEVLQREDLKGAIEFSRPALESGAESGDLRFRFQVERFPTIKVQGYTGLSAKKLRVTVPADAVEAELVKLQEQHTQMVPVEDRTVVEAGDHVRVSYQGIGDGPVAEIRQDEQELDLSSEDLVAGFADGVVGQSVDEVRTIDVTLPEPFGLADLAGKTIQVEVRVLGILRRDVPALDDALARESGQAETIEELRSQITARLESARAEESDGKLRRSLIEQVCAVNPVVVPPMFLDSQARREVMHRLEMLKRQGIEWEKLGLNPMDLLERVRPEVEQSIVESLVLRAIGEAEGIEVSDADIDAECAVIAERVKVPVETVRQRYAEPEQREQLVSRLLFERVLDFVQSKATIELVDELVEAGADASEAAAAEQPEG